MNCNTYDQPYPVYPIGLAYIEGALREDGHETEVWDMIPAGESLEQATQRLRPDCIGLTMRNIDNAQSHNPRSFTQDLLTCVAKLRAVSAAPLILGGSGFSIFPDEIYELSGVEFGIVGEGETPDSMEQTIARAADLPDAMYFATIGMRVYPGTPLWRWVGRNQPADVAGDCLLEPRIHVEPPLTVAGIHKRLKLVQQGASNWAVGDPPPAFIETLVKLRRRCKGANQWEYVELMQRFAAGPQGAVPAVSANPDPKP